MKLRENEEASAGGITTLITVFLVAGLFFVVNGYGIDKLTALVQAAYTSMPTSQLRYDVVNWEIMVFRIEPIILLIGIGINHFINSLREYTGVVSLGEVLWGATQMITGTLFMIAVTLYGGAGMDSVVDVVSKLTIGGSPSDLFGAVQYTGPLVYGVLLLVTIALVVNFLILCVQTVDYANVRTYPAY